MVHVAKIVASTLAHHQVVAVVSAMSSEIKSEGTTSQLLKAADLAVKGGAYEEPLQKVRDHHLSAAVQAVSTESIRKEVQEYITSELQWVEGFLDAISVIRELSPRSQDILMATGERLSARMLTATLQDQGVPAEMVDLVEVVPDHEQYINPGFFNRLQTLLGERCRPSEQRVPIVTGFIGQIPGGLLKAVGRGYTDFTAAMISAGLGGETTEEMQVWKEVDGIFSADPRKVPNARVLSRISPAEAAELTYFGSEVLHPFTMERVVGAKIPIRIKNTFNPEGEGTVILHDGLDHEDSPNAQDVVTAVTAKRGITTFSVTSNRMYNAHGFMARVFKVLEDHQVSVDLIATSEVSISCTVDGADELKRAVPSLEELGRVSLTPGRAILAMVGEGMKYAVGTAGRMFSTLGASGINIEIISQGASEINISCVIKEEDVEQALISIHQAFLEQA